MVNLRSTFGIFALLALASCHSFSQKVNVGPGTGSIADHTFEIVVMLLGAFLLGLWLGWILWNRYQQQVEALRLENESLNGSVSTLRGESDTLRKRLSNAEAERAELKIHADYIQTEHEKLEARLAIMENQNLDLREDNAHLHTEIGIAHVHETPDEVPLEIVTEPAPEPEFIVLPEPEVFEPEAIAAVEHEPIYFPEPEPMPEPEPIVVHESIVEVIDEPMPEPEPIIIYHEPEPIVNFHEPEPEPIVIHDEPEHHISMVAEELAAPAIEPEPIVIEHIEAPEIQAVVSEPAAEIEPESPDSYRDETPQAFVESLTTLVVPMAHANDRRDDLKIVEGIGPKIEELLFAHSISTYQQLATTPVTRLKEILNSAGSRYQMHDPGTWPAQALLANNGEWENLKAYQGFLNAGKRPT